MPQNDGELLPGTFDMLILKALSLGPMHGWGIAERIERLSGGTFSVQQGTVYPALQRLLHGGLVTAKWQSTVNNRRARFYQLTASGRRRLEADTAWWRRSIGGVERILRAAAQDA